MTTPPRDPVGPGAPRAPGPRPIEKFLGRPAAAPGPFAVLGLTPQDTSPDLIILQLQRQLERVASHPEASSYEADEVRLALHAAAARLLEHAAAAPGPSTPEPAPSRLAMEQAVLTTLAHCGGWNRHAIHRLTLIAQSRGVGFDDLVEAIRGVTRPARQAPSPQPARTAPRFIEHRGRAQRELSARPTADQIDPGARRAKLALLVGAGAIAALVLAAIVVVSLLNKPAPPANPTPSQAGPAAPPPASPTPPPVARRTTPNDDLAAMSFDASLRELDACVRAAQLDPGQAAQRFGPVLEALARRWDQATPDRLAAAQNSVVDLVYVLSRSSADADRVADALEGALAPLHGAGPPPTPDQIRTGVLSAGVLVRLSREANLPSAFRARVARALESPAFAGAPPAEATFQAGTTAALVSLARRLVPRDAPGDDALSRAWVAWRDAVLVTDPSQARRGAIILAALEGLARSGADPARHRATTEAISLLTTSLTWRPGEEAPQRLVRWLDDPAIPSGALFAVTASLAGKSAAPGFDATMVLSAGAGESDRATLRDRLRDVWGLAAASRRPEQVREWLARADEAISRPPGDSPASRLANAIECSRLVEDAARIATDAPIPRRETRVDLSKLARAASAGAGAGGASAPVGGATRRPVRGPGLSGDANAGAGSGSWPVRYAQAQSSIPARLQLLLEYAPGDEALVRVEAAMIVDAALRASPEQVRKGAVECVRRHAGHWAFVGAMLDESPTLPPTGDAIDLVRALALAPVPSAKAAGWRVEARRVLVERLLELLAQDDELGPITALEGLLAESYEARVRLLERAPEPGDGPIAPPPPEESASRARHRWRELALDCVATGREPLRLAELDRRHAARLAIAQGRLQAFAAHQVGAVEAMAYVAAASRAHLAGDARQVLDDLGERRRRARDVTEQIEACEVAALRLARLDHMGTSP